MKKQLQKPARSAINLAILGLLAGSNVHAGAFSLYTESSPVAIGNYAAGVAAEAADASTGWYNPAGLVLLGQKQVVFGGTGVFPSSKITGTSTYTSPISPLLPPVNYVQSFDGLDGASDAFVPMAHAAFPVSDRVAFGLSIVAPFGLATEWATDSPVRYQATFTELITANVAPEMGVRLTDYLALGVGLDVQYARVKFNRMLGAPAVLQFLGASPYQLDSMSYNKGYSWAAGYHVGAMVLWNEDHTRFGVNYQSRMNHQFNGFSRLTGPLAFNGLIVASPASRAAAVAADGVFQFDGLTSNEVDLPDILTLSIYHDVTDRIAVLGSAVYTGWGKFDNIVLNHVAAVQTTTAVIGRTPVAISNEALVQSISPQNYRDTWRFALGLNYSVNDQILVRVGGGYDQTPTNGVDRDVRLADSNRWALSAGAHYQPYQTLGFDIGYTHLFSAGDSAINRTDPIATSTYTVNASNRASANLVGLQAVWTMDAPEPTK